MRCSYESEDVARASGETAQHPLASFDDDRNHEQRDCRTTPGSTSIPALDTEPGERQRAEQPRAIR